jgi:hypothetical protein
MILDGDEIKITPIFISGLDWLVTINQTHITIGCERHEHKEWKSFESRRIAEMAGASSLKFWKTYKTMILNLAKTQNT